MKIGLFGLDFGSENLGCGALSYAFLGILDRISQESDTEISACVFTQEPCEITRQYLSAIEHIEIADYHLKKLPTMVTFWKKLKECDMVFDFTSGDSFSDIYGSGRVLKSELVKTLVLLSGTPLILGPQTYGPFSKALPKKWAAWIMRHADTVYARDLLSQAHVKEISGVSADCAIDVAFALPYTQPTEKEDVLRVGINVSGLLWNGGYTQNNQFGLTVDYPEYCTELIHWLKDTGAQVHLVGHVLCENMEVEDDLRAAIRLNEMCGGDCIIAPRFHTPMEAKSYIAGMDVFIGARMHATIAAVSSGCATIPFAYSRKFKGLYHTLSYPYVIEACDIDTEEALSLTKKWIGSKAELTQSAQASGQIAQEKLDLFVSDITKKMHRG